MQRRARVRRLRRTAQRRRARDWDLVEVNVNNRRVTDAVAALARTVESLWEGGFAPYQVVARRQARAAPHPADALGQYFATQQQVRRHTADWAEQAARRLEAALGARRWRTLVDLGYFDCHGVSGDIYRVHCAPPGNIVRHRDLVKFCLAHPATYAPVAMLLHCQFFLITHDERRFLDVANVLGAVGALPNGVVVGEHWREEVCYPTRGVFGSSPRVIAEVPNHPNFAAETMRVALYTSHIECRAERATNAAGMSYATATEER